MSKQGAENEINKLKPFINFMYSLEDSITDPNSKILVIQIKIPLYLIHKYIITIGSLLWLVIISNTDSMKNGIIF